VPFHFFSFSLLLIFCSGARPPQRRAPRPQALQPVMSVGQVAPLFYFFGIKIRIFLTVANRPVTDTWVQKNFEFEFQKLKNVEKSLKNFVIY
jgi:hypothetical protein